MKEHLLKVSAGDPAEVAKRLKQKGVRVLHRFGDTLVVDGEPNPKVVAEISPSIQAIQPPAQSTREVSGKEIALQAFRLRQTEAYRRSKTHRKSEGEEWDAIFEDMLRDKT